MKKFKTFLLLAGLASGILTGHSEAIKDFGSTSGSLNEKVRVHKPSRALSTISVVPAPGIVKSLKDFKIVFVGVNSLAVDDTKELPLLLSSSGAEVELKSSRIENNNQLILEFDREVIEEGTYSLFIFKEYVMIDGATLNDDLHFTYTVTDSEDDGIISVAPAGVRTICQSDFLSYFVLEGGLSGMPIAGKPLHYIIGEDGNLYLYNIMTIQPYGGTQTSSYVVGVPSGENKWKFSFPQPIYKTAVDGETEMWYLNYLYTKVEDDGTSSYKINDEANFIEFVIDDNGNALWLRENESEDLDDGFAIGATRADGLWTGFANVVRSTYQKFTDVAPEIDPEEYEIWKLTTGPNGNRVSREVDVYFEGDEVWVRGFSKTYLPKAWAHGTVSGKNITFEPFIGECDLIGQYLFLYGYSSQGKTPLKFKYYPEEKGMTCNDEYIINPNQLFYYATESYEFPTLEFVRGGVQGAVEDIEADGIIRTEWFALDGMKLDNPPKGLCVRRTVYSSGRVETLKVSVD